MNKLQEIIEKVIENNKKAPPQIAPADETAAAASDGETAPQTPGKTPQPATDTTADDKASETAGSSSPEAGADDAD